MKMLCDADGRMQLWLWLELLLIVRCTDEEMLTVSETLVDMYPQGIDKEVLWPLVAQLASVSSTGAEIGAQPHSPQQAAQQPMLNAFSQRLVSALCNSDGAPTNDQPKSVSKEERLIV